jgi:AbrB family looped-hinge helix DNA binding protein
MGLAGCGFQLMRITPEGQITIPAEIRQRLGLLPDTEVEFEVTEDGLYLRS